MFLPHPRPLSIMERGRQKAETTHGVTQGREGAGTQETTDGNRRGDSIRPRLLGDMCWEWCGMVDGQAWGVTDASPCCTDGKRERSTA
jgi:hypothetical protein